MSSKPSGQLLREHTRNPRHLDLHLHTKHKEMFMRQDCCACTPQAHLDLSPYAKRHVPAKKLLRSHAASTLGSLGVRKQTCSCDNTAVSARCEHTWSSLRAQKDMFRRKNCFILTPGAHLDLALCAKRNVPSKRLLRSHSAGTLGSLCVRKQEKKICSCDRLRRSHATSTLGSLSVRKKTCSGKATSAFSRREHTWIALRAQRGMFHRKDCCDLALPTKIDDF